LYAGVWEIRQAAAVIEVHVGQYDVAHIFWLVAEADNLMKRGLLRV